MIVQKGLTDEWLKADIPANKLIIALSAEAMSQTFRNIVKYVSQAYLYITKERNQ
jgi:hypothetical protein